MLITAMRQFRQRVSRLKTRKRKQPNNRHSAEVLEERALLTAITVTAEEQLMLELVNRARLDPTAEASLHGVGLNDGLAPGTISADAKQPLAFEQILTTVAGLHSQDMIDDDFFSHINTEAKDENDRATAAGYALSVAENIGVRGTTGSLDVAAETTTIHAGLFESPLHRLNLLDGDAVEVGIGLETGTWVDHNDLLGGGASESYNALLATQNFGAPDLMYITGVVYHDDVVNDDFYTVGEGHSSGTIGILSENGEDYTSINSVGGYQFAVPAGDYIVVFNDGTTTYIVEDIEVSDQNVKVDFETTTAAVEVDIDVVLPASIAENAGTATGTVTRGDGVSGDVSQDFVVSLFTESPDISVPLAVTIPAGQHSVDFTITVNDNATLDGTREAEIFIDALNAVPDADTVLITDYETSLVVSGTAADDTFNYIHEFAPNVHQLTVNGTSFEFAGPVLTLQINGLDGSDTLNLEASSGKDIANFSPHQVEVTTFAPGLIFTATTMEVIRVDANGGADDQATFSGLAAANDSAVLKPQHAWMTVAGSYYNFAEGFDLYDATGNGDAGDAAQVYDSPGDDTVIAFDTDSSLVGAGFALQTNSFPKVDIWATAGGNDLAQITDSSGNDTYEGRPARGALTTSTAVVTAHLFEDYELLGTGGGTDVAYLYDSIGDDTFTSDGTISRLVTATGVEHEINGFDTVVARSTAGGTDTAVFDDTFEDDLYVAKYNASYMSGEGFYNYASDFENTIATSTAGSDTAQLYDSPGTDNLVSQSDHTTLSGTGFNSRTEDFGTVLVFSTLGGEDSATFHDSADDDLLVARFDYTYLLNSTQYNYAAGFASTYAYSTLGGNDTVQFYDSSGDDFYITKPAYAYMYDTAGTYFNYVSGFTATAAYSVFGGYDQAQLYDSTGSDHVVAQSSAVTIDVGTTGIEHRAVYFDRVDVWSTNGGTDTVDQHTGLDFEFRRFGSWI